MGHGLASPCRHDLSKWPDCQSWVDAQAQGTTRLLSTSVFATSSGSRPPRLCCSPGPAGEESQAGSNAPPGVLAQLLAAEGNLEAEEKLFSNWKSYGCILVACVDFVDRPETPSKEVPLEPRSRSKTSCCGLRQQAAKPTVSTPRLVTEPQLGASRDSELKRQMSVIGHLRSLMSSRVWSEQVRLVKVGGASFVAFSPSVMSLLGAACRISQLMSEFPDWLELVAPELSGPQQLKVRITMEAGDMLPLPGECFGEPALVAATLSRDAAQPGELLLGTQCMEAACSNKALLKLISCLQLQQTSLTEHGTQLVFHRAEVSSLASLLPPSPGMPCVEDQEGSPQKEAVLKRLAVFVVDIASALRPSRKLGPLHNLRLVLSAQGIVAPLVARHSGHLYKFDGERVVAVFPSCDKAFACTHAILKEVADFNLARIDPDFHLRIGCALEYGDVCLRGYDIMGKTLDRASAMAEEAASSVEVLATSDFVQKVTGKGLPTSFRLHRRVSESYAHGSIQHCSVTFAM